MVRREVGRALENFVSGCVVAVLAEERRPLVRCESGIAAAPMHDEQVDRSPERVEGACFVAFKGEPAREHS